MRKALPYAIGGLLCVLLYLFMQGRQERGKAQYEADARRILAESRANEARADSLALVAFRAEGRASAAEARADALGSRARVVRVRVDTVPVPAEALPYTAPRDTLIGLLEEENGELRVALAESHTVADALRQSNALLRTSVDSLRSVLSRRPKPRSPLIPTLGAGLFAGVCADLKPCSGVGVTLSWRLSL